MPLTLTVLSFKGQPLMPPLTATIGSVGGTIGRSNHNTLVLADPERFVSRQHATISFKDGTYYLIDSSLSGVFIDDQPQALHNSSQPIFDGSRIKIGEYEIAVSIREDLASEDVTFVQTQTETDGSLFSEAAKLQDAQANRLFGDNAGPFVSHEQLLQKPVFQPDFDSALQNRSPMFDSYIAPAVVTPPSFSHEEIPENLSFEDLLTDTASSEIPTPLAQTPPPLQTGETEVQTAVSDFALNAFLKGAQLPNLDLKSEQVADTMQRVGQMFRKLIDGTVALLRSRAEFKSLLRVNMTVIKSSHNNPLKFTVSTNDVLRQLLENKGNGFLDASTAIDEGFNDIMDHQLAMQAGIQAALTDLLKNFDPKRIEKQFEQGFVLQKSSKCWDKYCEVYQYVVDNAIDDFFGEAFVEAYEAQMKILTARRFNK